jgi:transaldolase
MQIQKFVDAAELDEIKRLRLNPDVAGFTTNPTLMRKAGIKDYISFAEDAVKIAYPLPISLEVFADETEGILKQAKVLKSLGENVFVKLPVTNTKGDLLVSLAQQLNEMEVRLNVTAIMTIDQVEKYSTCLNPHLKNILSVFAGRIADAGVDPLPIVKTAVKMVKDKSNCSILWASPREIFNLVQAAEVGCHIITMTPELWKKMVFLGKNLDEFSLDTVKMFYEDALSAGYTI